MSNSKQEKQISLKLSSRVQPVLKVSKEEVGGISCLASKISFRNRRVMSIVHNRKEVFYFKHNVVTLHCVGTEAALNQSFCYHVLPRGSTAGILTVRKGCRVFCNTLLSVTVWATSSCKDAHFETQRRILIQTCKSEIFEMITFLFDILFVSF